MSASKKQGNRWSLWDSTTQSPSPRGILFSSISYLNSCLVHHCVIICITYKDWVDRKELNLRHQGHNLALYHWATTHIMARSVGFEPTEGLVSPSLAFQASAISLSANSAYGADGGIRTHTRVASPNGFRIRPLHRLSTSAEKNSEHCSIFNQRRASWHQ